MSMRITAEPLKLIVEAITRAGYKPGEEICIALDPAASEFHNTETGMYEFCAGDRAALGMMKIL